MTVWLTVINILLHVIHIIIDRLIKCFTEKSFTVSSYQRCHTFLFLSLLSLMVPKELSSVSTDSIEYLTEVDVLGDAIIIAIYTGRKSKKRPDESIYEFFNKNFENANLKKINVNNRLTFMPNNIRITNNSINGKNSYFVVIMNNLN